jgi:L-histidine N-alpha-methyltransferase
MSMTSRRDRIADVMEQLAEDDSPLRLGVWERGIAARSGMVMKRLKGGRKQVRRIEDGYQYVGAFPAQMWKTATGDDQYKTLSHGIKTFPKRFAKLQGCLDVPMDYVSIGPGTGEKDRVVLRHLQKLGGTDPAVYIPVDISADLLRMSLEVAMQEVQGDVVQALSAELDIANDEALEGLKKVVGSLADGRGTLVSLLGNTLANFRDDRQMLGRISSLLSSPKDMLLLEVASTREASEELAALAEEEYEGSASFRNFVMAALSTYTDCTSETGDVVYQGCVADQTLQVTTLFTVSKPRRVTLSDNDHLDLEAGGTIELYRSRKYTPQGLEEMLAGLELVATVSTPFSDDFGVVTLLLRRRDGEAQDSDGWDQHPAARL